MLKPTALINHKNPIITKYVKKRWAIILHWSFNFSALIISIYLSSKYGTFWYVFINLLAINALWFYSVYFKKKIFLGNAVIAILTGVVPLLALSFFCVFKRQWDSMTNMRDIGMKTLAFTLFIYWPSLQ